MNNNMNLQNFSFSKFLLKKYPIAIKGYTKYYILVELGRTPTIVNCKPETSSEIQIIISDMPEDPMMSECLQYICKHFQKIYFMKNSGRHSTKKFFREYSKNSLRFEQQYHNYSSVKRKRREFVDIPEDLDEAITSVVSGTLNIPSRPTEDFWFWVQPLITYIITWMTYYLFVDFYKYKPSQIIIREVNSGILDSVVNSIKQDGKYPVVFSNEDIEFVVAEDSETKEMYKKYARGFLSLYLVYLKNVIDPWFKSWEIGKGIKIPASDIHLYTNNFLRVIADDENLKTFVAEYDMKSPDLFMRITKEFTKHEYIPDLHIKYGIDHLVKEDLLLRGIRRKIRKTITIIEKNITSDVNFRFKPIEVEFLDKNRKQLLNQFNSVVGEDISGEKSFTVSSNTIDKIKEYINYYYFSFH